MWSSQFFENDRSLTLWATDESMVFGICVHSVAVESEVNRVIPKLYYYLQFSDLPEPHTVQIDWNNVARQVERDLLWRLDYKQETKNLERLSEEGRSKLENNSTQRDNTVTRDNNVTRDRNKKRNINGLMEGIFQLECQGEETTIELLLGREEKKREEDINVIWRQVSPFTCYSILCHTQENILLARRNIQNIVKLISEKYKKLDIIIKPQEVMNLWYINIWYDIYKQRIKGIRNNFGIDDK